MTDRINTLADKLGETQRRMADLEAKTVELRQKLIALGQSSIVGERFIATIRKTAVHEIDMDALRKRISEDQLRRCLVPVEHVLVMVHERDADE